MEKKIKFLAIIPARSGSKGIKNKNIRSFCGKPLVYYTIKEAKKCKKLDRIIVSTDSSRYAKIAEKYGATAPFLRPVELAQDNSLIIDSVIDIVNKLKEKENYYPDYVVLLQTTSPLRDFRDIRNCINLALTNECDTVMSVCPTENLIYEIKNNYLELLYNKEWLSSSNRQEFPPLYKINGPAVLISKTDSIIKNRSFLKGEIIPYIMKKWKSIDLDDEEDFLLAEIVYKKMKLIIKKLRRK